MLNRIADRVDLAIDVLTLGQYGLEQAPAEAVSCEGTGKTHRPTGREARSHSTRRRGDCETTPAISWDWPHGSRRDAVSG